MGYKVVQKVDGYGPRQGLEGPFTFGSGRTVYYDPKEGQYWDPKTDIYLTNDEALDLQGAIFDRLRG
jgi:hypothetical protein